MYVLGGSIVRRDSSASVLKFDCLQGIWSEVMPMPQARYDHATCVLGNDIYVFGGYDTDAMCMPASSRTIQRNMPG
jgi:hypothetical protein